MKATLLFILTIPGALLSQDASFKWAVQFGAEGMYNFGQSMTVDSKGNVYTTGRFSCTADFDPGPGVYNLETLCSDWEGDGNLFVSKLDAAGNFVWAKNMKINGAGWVFGNSIVLDQGGNIYITGPFYGTIDFDPGPCDYWVTSATPAVFVLKLTSSGDFNWVKTTTNSGESYSIAHFLTLDASGNIYATGRFLGTTDFDPGNGIFELTEPQVASPYWSPRSGFILKLDGDGNFIWAKQLKGNNGTRYVANAGPLAINNSGNLLIAGSFAGTVDFDPGPGTYYQTSLPDIFGNPAANAFILKLDLSGNFIWAKHIANNDSSESWVNSIGIDRAENIITSGGFTGTSDFDPGTGIFNITSTYGGGASMFISKIDPTGNFLWAKGFEGTNDPAWTQGPAGGIWANSTVLDSSGNIYTVGGFYQMVDFDPGTAVFNLSTLPNSPDFLFAGVDMFILKLDPQGSFSWVQQIQAASGTYTQQVNPLCIQLDKLGNIYTCGAFIGTIDFDPGGGTANVANPYGVNIFIQKLGNCIGSSASTLDVTDCKSFTLNGHTYTESGIYTQTILNHLGCDSIITLNLTLNRVDTTINISSCGGYTRCHHNGDCIECRTYQTSGTYTEIYPTATGCDSVVRLNLTIVPVHGPNIYVTACNSYYWHNQTFTASGTYSHTISTVGACDTTVTLHLTIVSTTVSVTAHPTDVEVCAGTNTSFSVSAFSNQTMSYEWQVSTDGGVRYNPVVNGGFYSGTNGPVLTVTNTQVSMNNNRYRCRISNNVCSNYFNHSNAAVLTVRKLPVAELTAVPFSSLFPWQSTELSAIVSASSGGNTSFAWYFNNAFVSDVGNRRTVNFNQLGSYQVQINERWTNGLICSSRSGIITVDARSESRLMIFPNPNHGEFRISYYNPSGISDLQVVTVYDSKGARVHRAKFALTGIYTSIDISRLSLSAGFYSIVISDSTGKKLTVGKIIVN